MYVCPYVCLSRGTDGSIPYGCGEEGFGAPSEEEAVVSFVQFETVFIEPEEQLGLGKVVEGQRHGLEPGRADEGVPAVEAWAEVPGRRLAVREGRPAPEAHGAVDTRGDEHALH